MLIFTLRSSLCAFAVSAAFAEPITVTIDPATVRSIGGVSEFNRAQFITVHASPTDPDTTDAQFDYLVNELEVSYGRDGGIQSVTLQETPADPDNPDLPDVAWLKRKGAEQRAANAENPRYLPAFFKEIVLCTHPENFVAKPDQGFTPWGPRTQEAAATWVSTYLKHFYNDEDRPKYIEVFNEPFVHAKDIGVTAEQMARQHVVEARAIKAMTPDVMVGGYSAAWAEVEARNFEHWNNWQKMFMDVAGADMDFFSTHLYDGINVKGTHAERTGSNTEAILDLIDHYSFLRFGVAKPQTITEYGRIIREPGSKAWPERTKRVGQLLRSFNGMLTTFMDHPDRLIKTVPFILSVADWTYQTKGGSEEEPYEFLLYRKTGDTYVTTELVLFYKFWKGVHGQWRTHQASDPDIRVHALADGKRLNVIFTNLDDAARSVSLAGLDGLDVRKVALRTLTTHEDVPELRERTLWAVPETLELALGESALLMIDVTDPIAAERTVTETRTYATDYLQAIEAGQPVRFTFENTPVGEGEALLRLSIGRTPDLSLAPVITINGKKIDTPTDWMGGGQVGRPTFFGMIGVPVPMDLVKEINVVELVFPDGGGKVAAAVLQTSVAE